MPPFDLSNVMDEAKFVEINGALETLRLVLNEIAKAKRAGIDMAIQETDAITARDKLQKIKAVYYPNR